MFTNNSDHLKDSAVFWHFESSVVSSFVSEETGHFSPMSFSQFFRIVNLSAHEQIKITFISASDVKSTISFEEKINGST